MTIDQTLTLPVETLAGPARQGVGLSPFWRRVEELLAANRLHGSSDVVLEIAMRYNLTDDERLQELDRLAARELSEPANANTNQQGATVMLQNQTGPAIAPARREGRWTATEIRNVIMSKPKHIQMLAASCVLGELIADTVTSRQLGPVEGLLDEIENYLDYDDEIATRQYARGLAALAEDIRCRLANL